MRFSIERFPAQVVLIRHGDAYFNSHKRRLDGSPVYASLLEEYRRWIPTPYKPQPHVELVTKAAAVLKHDLIVPTSDHGARLTDRGHAESLALGKRMPKEYAMPDAVYLSPFERVLETHRNYGLAFQRFRNITPTTDVRIRGREKGLMNVYSDWRLFTVFHPEQRLLKEKEGSFYYRYPNGENVPDIMARVASWANEELPQHAGKIVWVFCHHTTIMCFRALCECMDMKAYEKLDKEDEPPTCSISCFEGETLTKLNGEEFPFGKLVLKDFNKQFV